jgi:hypothetical protein
MFRKQSTSARTRFLMLDCGGVCAFGGLPNLSQLVEVGDELPETLAHHPASVTGRAERELGLEPGSLQSEAAFAPRWMRRKD